MKFSRLLFLFVFLAAPFVFIGTNQAQNGVPIPLIGEWSLDDDKLTDSGTDKLSGTAQGAAVVAGKFGSALSFGSTSKAQVANKAGLGKNFSALTLTGWAKLEALPAKGSNQKATLLAKRGQNVNAPFIVAVDEFGRLLFEGHNGLDWNTRLNTPKNSVPVGAWFHFAFSLEAGAELTAYLNGVESGSKAAPLALAANDQPLLFGRDPNYGAATVQLDQIRLYAATLSPAQLQTDMNGTLSTRAIKDDDFAPPTHVVKVALGRFDAPLPATDGFGRTRFLVERKSGPDAVDWPVMMWKNRKILEKAATENLIVPLREGDEARPLFQTASDEVLQPGNHWFRAVGWMWGRRIVYTPVRTSRSKDNDLEIWTFPVLIQGEGDSDVQNVVLKNDGQEIYSNTGPFRSLTLLLPQNQSGKPYELSVNGRPPLRFDAGLEPVQSGQPRDVVKTIRAQIGGAGPKITVQNGPPPFNAQKEWGADLAARSSAPAIVAARVRGWNERVGIDVPRSPLSINAVNLPHGMSAGFPFDSAHTPEALSGKGGGFSGSMDEYARYLAQVGFDATFEATRTRELDGEEGRKRDQLALALADRGLKFGLMPDAAWKRPFLGHPNLGFFAANLPEFRAPLVRDLQVAAQRMERAGNFAGVSIGADNAGYVTFWDWAAPIYDRPWAEAYINWTKGQTRSQWAEKARPNNSPTTFQAMTKPSALTASFRAP
jgi:hypothetical protein